MTSKRKTTTAKRDTRSALLDAAERLMLEEGYAAVTSRRLAAAAGLRSHLVHYYFRTMDELFLALMRRGSERMFARHARALASEQPLWALWDLASDEPSGRMAVEMLALASHRKPIAAEQAKYVEQLRAMHTAVLTRALRDYGLDAQDCPASVVAVSLALLPRALGIEATLGACAGHAETRAFVESWLTRLEGPRKVEDAAPRRRGAARG